MESIVPFAMRRAKFFERMLPNSIAFIFGAESGNHSLEFFHQHPEFFYLTGYTEANSILCLSKNQDNQFISIIFTEARDARQEQWSGPVLGPEQASQTLGIDQGFSRKEFSLRLPELLLGKTHIYHVLGKCSAHDQYLLNALETLQQRHRRMQPRERHWIDWSPWIAQWRLIKEAVEIQALRLAIRLSINALLYAVRHLSQATHEYQVDALLRAYYRWHGGYAPAYPPIVASGKHALILHYSNNSNALRVGELLLIDAACSCGGYAADLTRTIPINGRFSPPQKAIYKVVLSAQLAALQQVFPGSSWIQVEEAARRTLVHGLCAAGILHGDPEALYEARADKRYYTHSIGHWIGLEVHDPGGYEKSEGPIRFKEGMVLTIEPGLYLGQDPQIPIPFQNIGIRIEDMVLVTSTGHEILSEALPKNIDAIEAFMRAPQPSSSVSLGDTFVFP